MRRGGDHHFRAVPLGRATPLLLPLVLLGSLFSGPIARSQDGAIMYGFETVIECDAGECEKFQRAGWDRAAALTWTARTSAKLRFSVPRVKGPLALRMRLVGNVTPPEVPVQVVEVFANERKVALWLVEAADDFFAIIPSDVVGADGRLQIELKIPRAQRLPHSPPNETRRFGVACYEFEIAKAASVPPVLEVNSPLEIPTE